MSDTLKLNSPSLLDSIRKVIEERNLFSVRSRSHYVTALRGADDNEDNSGGSGWRNFKSPISTTGRLLDNRLIRMRNKVIQEIVKTEQVYVGQLRIIRDEFMNDTAIKLCFSRKDFNVLFNNVLTLLEVNEKLLEELTTGKSSNEENENSQMGTISEDEERDTPTSSSRASSSGVGTLHSVAEAFRNYTPYLKLYSLYASGYQQADDLLQTLTNQCGELKSLLKMKEERLRNKTLQSYLITPIQRIPRYKLLLQQLVGFIGVAGKCDPDVQSLLQSIKNLDQVALHMSDMIRQHENSRKLLEINEWMGKFYHGNLVEPGRTLVKSGTVQKPPSIAVPQEQSTFWGNNQFYLVLLSDQIIACKIKSELGSRGCLRPNLLLPLKKCSANIINDLYAEVECEGEFIRFTLTDADDLIEWVRIINDAVKSLRKRCATLKKVSSSALPMRKEEIKNILKANRKGAKRPFPFTPSVTSTPTKNPDDTPTPGKLKRYLNISDKLDELVNYLSPGITRILNSATGQSSSSSSTARGSPAPNLNPYPQRVGGRGGRRSNSSNRSNCSSTIGNTPTTNLANEKYDSSPQFQNGDYRYLGHGHGNNNNNPATSRLGKLKSMTLSRFQHHQQGNNYGDNTTQSVCSIV